MPDRVWQQLSLASYRDLALLVQSTNSIIADIRQQEIGLPERVDAFCALATEVRT